VDLLVGSLLCESADHLRQVFSTQMGLSDQDIVALSGGHILVGGFFCVCLSTFESWCLCIAVSFL
jgi:hypothetical protein